jgi:hypothetical protein
MSQDNQMTASVTDLLSAQRLAALIRGGWNIAAVMPVSGGLQFKLRQGQGESAPPPPSAETKRAPDPFAEPTAKPGAARLTKLPPKTGERR